MPPTLNKLLPPGNICIVCSIMATNTPPTKNSFKQFTEKTGSKDKINRATIAAKTESAYHITTNAIWDTSSDERGHYYHPSTENGPKMKTDAQIGCACPNQINQLHVVHTRRLPASTGWPAWPRSGQAKLSRQECPLHSLKPPLTPPPTKGLPSPIKWNRDIICRQRPPWPSINRN